MADGDRIDTVARALHAAYYTDTRYDGAEWPPAKPANHQAWRRAACAAIDLGARP